MITVKGASLVAEISPRQNYLRRYRLRGCVGMAHLHSKASEALELRTICDVVEVAEGLGEAFSGPLRYQIQVVNQPRSH